MVFGTPVLSYELEDGTLTNLQLSVKKRHIFNSKEFATVLKN